MLVVLARYQCRPGEGDAVADALREVIPLARGEEGCALFLVSRGQTDPDEFVLVEHFVDEAALQAHRETPHFRQIIEGRVLPLLEKRERSVLHPVEP
ncbi:hypothetical protein GCM10009535_56810 [Streptomyces thermocarboxydovorans]|uniref:ABM domain-containing protein n=1 Tax=Streptomyces thermocarboxydovorans TaxID=59298 RepID=A0ABP3T5E0_9ACTN